MKKIAILGSTGSIGTQTLEVVRANKDIEVTALAAGSNIDLLEKQIREFSPKIAAVWNEEKAKTVCAIWISVSRAAWMDFSQWQRSWVRRLW